MLQTQLKKMQDRAEVAERSSAALEQELNKREVRVCRTASCQPVPCCGVLRCAAPDAACCGGSCRAALL